MAREGRYVAQVQLTTALRQALATLLALGGEAVINKNGRAMARGVILPNDPVTWLRLFTLKYLEPAGIYRFRVSEAGKAAHEEYRL